MKCHIRVDSGSGLVHTITATAANAHDITEAHKLLREDDHVAYGDSGYIGIEKRDEIKNNEHFRKIDFRISRRPKSLPQVSDHAIDWERYIENRKSAVRCKVEHSKSSISWTCEKFQQAECAVCVCQSADGKTWTNKKSESTYKGISVPFCG